MYACRISGSRAIEQVPSGPHGERPRQLLHDSENPGDTQPGATKHVKFRLLDLDQDPRTGVA
jgi:hypothetical protein